MPDTKNDTGPVKRKRVQKITTFNEEFDFALFSLIAKRNWRLIAVIFITSFILSLLYLRYSAHTYEETSILQIGSDNTASKVLGTNMLNENSDDELAGAVELMRSRLFLEKVFKTLHTQISYYTEGTFMNHELYVNAPYVVEADSEALASLAEIMVYVHINSSTSGQISFTKGEPKTTIPFVVGTWFDTHYGKIKIRIKNYGEIEELQARLKKNAYFFLINNYAKLAKYYSSLISISLLNPSAKTIQISCRDYNDQKTSDIVNTIAEEYIKSDVEKRSKSAESILNFIDDQLGTVYGRIKLTESTLDTFQHRYNINANQQVVSSNMARLSSIEDQISAIDLQQKLMAHVQKEMSTKDADAMELVNLLSESDYANDLRENLSSLRDKLILKQQALYAVTPDNSNIIHINAMIDAAKKNILESIGDVNTKLEGRKQELDKVHEQLMSEIGNSTSNNNIEYLRLQRLFSIDEKYYDLLLEKKSEYEISKAGYVPRSQILENAIPSWIPASPKKSSSFLIGSVGGISISIIILLVIYLFYNNLTSLEEIERLSESPVTILGIVPLYTKEIPLSQLLVNHNPKSILAESFRTIRTNLQFVSVDDKKSKVIAVTSTISGEGKTFVSINLAGIIAFSGKKVIVIDLDMRKPRIHTALGIENNRGMSTLLIGKFKLEDVVQQTETDNLDVITAGPIPPNPSELVISKTMDNLLEELKTLYDTIIIDNPPVGLVTDGIAMMQKADYPIYVMRTNYSKREFIHFIDRLYFENHLNKLSIILNGVDFNKHRYGYGYYGYGHSYGQGDYYEA